MAASPSTKSDSPPTRRSFAALRDPGFRDYLIYSALAMMADSVEHVISYWIMFQKFHSPALGGFAVLSHWLPYLLFGVHSGALADRFDPRRVIQGGMAFFMLCSLGWGVLFLTDTLTMTYAVHFRRRYVGWPLTPPRIFARRRWPCTHREGRSARG